MSFKSGILSLSLLSILNSTSAIADNQPIRIIIKYKHAPMVISSLKTQITQATKLPVKDMKPMANGAYSLILDTTNPTLTPTVLERLRANPDVLYAVKDRVGHFKIIPDPKVDKNLSAVLSHDSQWDEFTPPAGIMLESKPGLRDGAWSYLPDSLKKPTVVAVLDTGIAANDSLNNNLLGGWNFAANNNNVLDETGHYHGTHVSGTIAGYGSVMNGISDTLKILTVKIPDENGMFYESAVVNGIYWSVGAEVPGVPSNNYPAKVLNMSFGIDLEPGREIDYCDEALQEAVFFARKQGAVLAVAAGNENVWEHYGAPAVCNGTLKIASTGPEGLRSYFSNYGPSVTIAAPGGDKRYGITGAILSTVNAGGGYNSSGFDFYQGTSMASPHVAGVAGLIFALSPQSLTAEQVEQIIYMTTHDFGKSRDENKSCVGRKPCGHGILNADQAVKAALADYDVLFSAPAFKDLGMKACGTGLFSAKHTKINSNNSSWVKTNTGCEPEANYKHPRLEQTKEGIYAVYGAARYQLEQVKYKECHVVGFDGVGCYF